MTKVGMGYLLSCFLWMYVLCLLPVGLLVDRKQNRERDRYRHLVGRDCLDGIHRRLRLDGDDAHRDGHGRVNQLARLNRVIREWFPASQRGSANSVFGAGAPAGPPIGAVLVAAIVAGFGWCGGFFVAGAIGFIWLVTGLLICDRPERVGWLKSVERDRILAERDGAVRLATAQPASPLWHLLTLRSVWSLFLTHGCEVFGGYMLLTWLPNYLQISKGLSVMNAGMLTAIPFGAATVMAVALGLLSDKLLSRDAAHAGQRRTMLAVTMISAASILLIPFISSMRTG